MSDAVLKQFVFDAAMELYYGHEGLSNKQIADRLMKVIQKHDEAEVESGNSNESLGQ